MKKSAIYSRFRPIIILIFLVIPVLVLVEEQMAKQEIYGCAVGVVENGKIVHVKAYGHHDRLRTKPITVNTIFRWASISKPVTAVAAFKAIETNKLALTDKVTKHVSYWPNTGNKKDITVAHMLNNRSGVNQYTNVKESNYKSKNNFNAKECVDVFSAAALDFNPGSQYKYTTFGFNLLGATVEEATNIPYEKYVKDNSVTVAQYLDSVQKGLTVTAFYRVALG